MVNFKVKAMCDDLSSYEEPWEDMSHSRTELPDDVVELICSFMPRSTLLEASLLNSAWFDITSRDKIWAPFITELKLDQFKEFSKQDNYRKLVIIRLQKQHRAEIFSETKDQTREKMRDKCMELGLSKKNSKRLLSVHRIAKKLERKQKRQQARKEIEQY
jgi:hypothetical protein